MRANFIQSLFLESWMPSSKTSLWPSSNIRIRIFTSSRLNFLGLGFFFVVSSSGSRRVFQGSTRKRILGAKSIHKLHESILSAYKCCCTCSHAFWKARSGCTGWNWNFLVYFLSCQLDLEMNPNQLLMLPELFAVAS